MGEIPKGVSPLASIPNAVVNVVASPENPRPVYGWLIPVATAIGGVALAVSQIAPEHTWAYKIAVAILGVLAVAGVASPGLSKK